MRKHETATLMAVIKTAYPEFNRGVDERVAIELWQTMLEPYSYQACNAAIKQHIQECKFAPKIAEIVERIKPNAQLAKRGCVMPQIGSPGHESMMAAWRWAHEDLGVQLTSHELSLAYGNGLQQGRQLLKEGA